MQSNNITITGAGHTTISLSSFPVREKPVSLHPLPPSLPPHLAAPLQGLQLLGLAQQPVVELTEVVGHGAQLLLIAGRGGGQLVLVNKEGVKHRGVCVIAAAAHLELLIGVAGSL